MSVYILSVGISTFLCLGAVVTFVKLYIDFRRRKPVLNKVKIVNDNWGIKWRWFVGKLNWIYYNRTSFLNTGTCIDKHRGSNIKGHKGRIV